MTGDIVVKVQPVPACVVVYEPGNGTRYNLTVTRDPQGGGGWMWLEGARVYACGWFGGDDLRVSFGKLSKPDRKAIFDALGLAEPQALLADVYKRPPENMAARMTPARLVPLVHDRFS